jgi:hypothetical protein
MYTAILSLAVFALMGTPVAAFHDAGVAHCNGCHTMHNSEDGVPVDPDSPDGNRSLLVDATPSDVCLGCHATGLGAVFTGSWETGTGEPEKGGGNFIYLTADNINDGHGGAGNPILGDGAGHNLDAPGFGLATDPSLGTAPGGTFNSANMACTSCHDPHGNADFRLLYGSYKVGYANDAPDADGISLFFGGESASNHTAYKDGMSEWCANCHGEFHDVSGASPFRHVSGAGFSLSSNYNTYNGSDDLLGGAQATAYLAEVPFEDPAMTTSSTAGPSGGSTVMCMSCHRAHATSAPNSGRWDFSVTFLHEDGAESGSYAIPDPYASVNQRSLCNKCHVKDANPS